MMIEIHFFSPSFLSLTYLLTVAADGYYSTWSYSDTPQWIGLLWTRDRPVAETSTWQHTTLTTNINAAGGIRNRDPSKRTTSERRLRRRVHWDRLAEILCLKWEGIGKDSVTVCCGSFCLRRRVRSGRTAVGARTVASSMRVRRNCRHGCWVHSRYDVT
jgi:hypothetical protein